MIAILDVTKRRVAIIKFAIFTSKTQLQGSFHTFHWKYSHWGDFILCNKYGFALATVGHRWRKDFNFSNNLLEWRSHDWPMSRKPPTSSTWFRRDQGANKTQFVLQRSRQRRKLMLVCLATQLWLVKIWQPKHLDFADVKTLDTNCEFAQQRSFDWCRGGL